MYERETKGVRVRVTPEFLDEESEPEDDRYIWAYSVEIENRSERTVKLLSRRWRILDSLGRERVVEGEGVVGEQPKLAPGERFTYTSGAPLETPSGLMVGAYRMKAQDGSTFEVDIPAFSLDSPYEVARVRPN